MTGVRNWPQGRRRGLAIALTVLLVAGIAALGTWFFTLCRDNQQQIDAMNAEIDAGQAERNLFAVLEVQREKLKRGDWQRAAFVADDGASGVQAAREKIDSLASAAGVVLESFGVQVGDEGTLEIDVTAVGEIEAVAGFLEAASGSEIVLAVEQVRIEPAGGEETPSTSGAQVKASLALEALWLAADGEGTP